MIPHYDTLDRTTLDRHLRLGTPFLVPGYARSWPAVTNWTPATLARDCGSTLVPVSHYPDGATLESKRPMSVADYLAAISATPDSWQQYYMESVELSDMSPELQRDTSIPQGFNDLPDISDTVFFGLKTGSCCHIHAHEEAIVFQLMGVKKFVLYHPNDVRNLYFELVSEDYRRSRLDFTEPIDERRFPRAKYLQPIEIDMHPGDALYLPVHWAHWTAADDFTFTLTRFFTAKLRHYRFPSPGVRCLVGRALKMLGR